MIFLSHLVATRSGIEDFANVATIVGMTYPITAGLLKLWYTREDRVFDQKDPNLTEGEKRIHVK